MNALILAGGQGTRLRPHTEAVPKPLLPLGKYTILDRQIRTLERFGIERITLVTGYFAEKIRAHVAAAFPGRAFSFVHNAEFERSRPAFAIIQALPGLLGGDCLYLNGDVLCHPEVLARVLAAPASATAVQKTPWDEEQVNVIQEPGSGRITRLSKEIAAEHSHGEFIGVTKLTQAFLQALHAIARAEGAETFRHAFAVDLLDRAINQRAQALHAIDVTDLPALEIDTPADYERALQTYASLEE